MRIEELRQTLAAFEGATFASLDTVTIPTLTGGKANPFKGKVAKHCVGHRVMLFTNKKTNGYENKVRRHLEQSGLDPDSFQLGPLPWGNRIPNSPLIEHGDKHYLQAVFLEAGTVEYRAIEPIQKLNTIWEAGSKIDKHMIEGLSDKTGSEHQGLSQDKQVIVRTYALESIKAIRCMGVELQ